MRNTPLATRENLKTALRAHLAAEYEGVSLDLDLEGGAETCVWTILLTFRARLPQYAEHGVVERWRAKTGGTLAATLRGCKTRLANRIPAVYRRAIETSTAEDGR